MPRLRVFRFLIVAGATSAWIAAKNWIRRLRGHPKYFDERGRFWRQYVWHLTGIRPIRQITCVGLKREGPGSQALTIMQAINFARVSGLTYVHTPFSHIQHADRPMDEWAAAWEQLFNLGAGEAVCGADRRAVVAYCHNFGALELCLGWDDRQDELVQSFRALTPELKRKYYRDRRPRKNDVVTVAVHMRRGHDVSDTRNAHLFTSTDKIARILSGVRSVLDARHLAYQVDVYSEGTRADFAEVNRAGVEGSMYRVGHYPKDGDNAVPEAVPPGPEPFVDMDTITAMQALIEADILIMAKSSFSYCAAILSDGIPLFEAPFRPPMGDWIPCRPDGSFDVAMFERQLTILLQAKATHPHGTGTPGHEVRPYAQSTDTSAIRDPHAGHPRFR